MLDGESTAERLRAALVEGYGRWHQADPQRNTKAELAREVARRSGRPCTPQTVSGWFKTGRMDKAWIGYVEQILGTTLGFGSAGSALEGVAMKALLTSGVVPSYLTPNGPVAVPDWLLNAIPGRRFYPDFFIDLGGGRRMFIEVLGHWHNAEKQAALLIAQREHRDEFRVLGLAGGSLVEEVVSLADELLERNRRGEIRLSDAGALQTSALTQQKGSSLALSSAVELVGQYLAQADEMTRESLALLVTQLARNPEDAARIGRRMEALLKVEPGGDPAGVVDASGHRPSLGNEPGDSQLGGLDALKNAEKTAGGKR